MGETVCADDTWGIIGRETLGDPSAVYRTGPYARTDPTVSAADVPPPYGSGSIGIIVDDEPDEIAFGNETDFAELPVGDITTLSYWVFAGTDSMADVSLPSLTIEADPNVGTTDVTKLIYLPEASTAPSAPATPTVNTWQQYDAGAAGSAWYATGATGTLIGCTQATPCTFDELKARLPDAVITFSLGFASTDGPFIGAIDGLQVNNTVYDFEFLGTRKTVAADMTAI
ncbi:hypothetical protein ACIBCT_19990 [Streptosporangium sp. NPDC050855]|uniref:hypothetical protein n=1 Tax=Streptosporangium sp. NPDC050855 TaxID=3366194 RepID=UPI00378D5A58